MCSLQKVLPLLLEVASLTVRHIHVYLFNHLISSHRVAFSLLHCDITKCCTGVIRGYASKKAIISYIIVQKEETLYATKVCPCTRKKGVNDGTCRALQPPTQLEPKQC